jgi:hypothetical protein
MALNLSGLSTYTDELSHELITKSVAGAETLKTGVTVIEGIKHSQQLNYFDTDLVLQADSCGFNASGTTPLTKKVLTVCSVKSQETLCPKDYNAYWAALKAPKGSKDDVLVFAEAYLDKKSQLIARRTDDLMWRGDTALPNTDPMHWCDGWLKRIASSTDKINVVGTDFSPTITTITKNNIREIMYKAESLIPDNIRGADDLTLYMSKTLFRMYTQALVDANSYYQSPKEGNEFEAYLLGTNVKVVGINGLTGVNNKMVLTRASNLVFGTDLADEVEGGSVDLWYSKDNRDIRFTAHWKLGTQVYFTNEVVYVNI